MVLFGIFCLKLIYFYTIKIQKSCCFHFNADVSTKSKNNKIFNLCCYCSIHCWQRISNPLINKNPHITYSPFFQILFQPPCSFLLHCLFDWMGNSNTYDKLFFTSWHYGSTHVEQGNKASVHWGLTHVFFASTLIWYHTHKDTHHTQGPTPPVLCLHQLPGLHWMDHLLISKICFTEFHNVFAFKKLLTCRNHISDD